MKYRKMWAAASMTAEGLIVTGGWSGRSLFHTEIFSKGSWKIGPSLPVRLGAHCQVSTKAGVIVAGLIVLNQL